MLQKRLTAKQYKTLKQFSADVRQVFINARIYNDTQSDIYKHVRKVYSTFKDDLQIGLQCMQKNCHYYLKQNTAS